MHNAVKSVYRKTGTQNKPPWSFDPCSGQRSHIWDWRKKILHCILIYLNHVLYRYAVYSTSCTGGCCWSSLSYSDTIDCRKVSVIWHHLLVALKQNKNKNSAMIWTVCGEKKSRDDAEHMHTPVMWNKQLKLCILCHLVLLDVVLRIVYPSLSNCLWLDSGRFLAASSSEAAADICSDWIREASKHLIIS